MSTARYNADGTVTVTDRSDDARERAIRALRLILELLEKHPDRIEGLQVQETPCNDGTVGFIVSARARS